MNAIPSPTRLYYYRPIAGHSSEPQTVWKCAGHGAEDPTHRAFFEPYFANHGDTASHLSAGCKVVTHYLGNRVALVDLERNAA